MKRAKKLVRKPAQTETDSVVSAEHFHRMLDGVEKVLTAALCSYGTLRQRMPTSGVEPVPVYLADIAIKLHMMRHFIDLGTVRR